MGRRRLLKHGAQTGKPCGQSGRRPSQGTERGGSGGGADGFIIGGAEKPFDVYSRHQRQRRSSGTWTMSAKKREKKKRKKTGARNDLHAAVRVVAFGRSTGGSRGFISSNQAARKANNIIQDWMFVANGRVLALRAGRSHGNLTLKSQ